MVLCIVRNHCALDSTVANGEMWMWTIYGLYGHMAIYGHIAFHISLLLAGTCGRAQLTDCTCTLRMLGSASDVARSGYIVKCVQYVRLAGCRSHTSPRAMRERCVALELLA